MKARTAKAIASLTGALALVGGLALPASAAPGTARVIIDDPETWAAWNVNEGSVKSAFSSIGEEDQPGTTKTFIMVMSEAGYTPIAFTRKGQSQIQEITCMDQRGNAWPSWGSGIAMEAMPGDTIRCVVSLANAQYESTIAPDMTTAPVPAPGSGVDISELPDPAPAPDMTAAPVPAPGAGVDIPDVPDPALEFSPALRPHSAPEVGESAPKQKPASEAPAAVEPTAKPTQTIHQTKQVDGPVTASNQPVKSKPADEEPVLQLQTPAAAFIRG